MLRIITTLAFVILIILSATSHAYQISNGFFSPTGGGLHRDDNKTIILTSNMQPYGSLTHQDLALMNTKAQNLLTAGTNYLSSLSLFNCENDATCGGNQCLAKLLRNEIASYEDCTSFVTGLANAEANFESAIQYFAYLHEHGYQDALPNLRKALRDLISMYLVFGDEFLVDALHLRFTSTLPNMDQYLSQQSLLLGKALDYYQKGARTFLWVSLEPILWSDQVIGGLFEQDEWDLFNVLYNRLAMAIREKAVKDRVLMAESLDNVKQRLATAVADLYLQATLLGSKLGDSFLESQGEQILTALTSLEQQLSDIKNNLNPLGYDDRYVPLAEFEKADGGLYPQATTTLGSCKTDEAGVKQEQRTFDQDLSQYGLQLQQLNASNRAQLAGLTGCSQSLPEDGFIDCSRYAGEILFDECPLDLGSTAFDTCLQAKKDLGILGELGDKYRQIKDADLGLKRAQLQFDNVNKQIDNEIASQAYQVKIISQYFTSQQVIWSQYQEAMKNACRIEESSEKSKIKGGKTTRTTSTTKTCTLEDTGLSAQVSKEKDLLEVTRTFQIQQALDPKVVQNLLLQQADALVGIDVAVNHKNTMIASFDAGLRQRDNILAAWQQGQRAYSTYLSQPFATERILLSNLVVQLSSELNELAHFSYLASKALEYRYAAPLTGIDLGSTGKLNLTDLFKCQSSADFEAYLHKLDVYDNSWCGQRGTFVKDRYGISLAYDILGLTDKDLGDANGDKLVDSTGEKVDDVRYQKVQQFINNHIDANGDLAFTFSTNVFSSTLQSTGRKNVKIWAGTVPCSSSGKEALGLTASLFFRGSSGAILPHMTITQKGTHTLLNKSTGAASQYYPINTFTMLSASDTDPPFKQDTNVWPFNGIELLVPESDGKPAVGNWSPVFANCSAAAGEWEITLEHQSVYPNVYQDIPFNKMRDIWFYFDAIGQ